MAPKVRTSAFSSARGSNSRLQFRSPSATGLPAGNTAALDKPWGSLKSPPCDAKGGCEAWLACQLYKFQLTAKVIPVDGYDAGIRRVVDRSANVFFADRSILLDAATRSPSAGDLTVLDRLFTYGPLALALARGDEDFRLLVDKTLSQFFRSENFHGLYVKWFGQPGESAVMFFRLSALPE